MKLKIIACFIFLFTAFISVTKAQNPPLLTLKDAVEIALQNNYNIKITQNTSTIAKNNVTLGNAGFLPSVNANFSSTNSIQNTNLTRADGSSTSFTNAKNTNISRGVTLNWTIFDGFAMFANYDQLKEQNKLGELFVRDTIVRTVSNVVATYYNLVNQNEVLNSLKGAMRISKTQLRYANDKFAVGAVSRLEVLNAEVNVNTDTANYVRQLQQFKNTKIQFNQLLVRDLQTDFTVADTIIVDDKIVLADILNNAASQNPAILAAQINERLAEINLRQIKSTRYPQIGVTTGYNFSNSRSPSGFAQRQNAQGLNYGLTATINIFDGFNQNRLEKNAKIQIDNSKLAFERAKLNIQTQINTLYTNYLSGLELTRLGKINVEVARRNLEITLDKYRLGNITTLEVRQAEENHVNAQVNYFAAQYQSKIAEITLKQITNNINIQ
ncbi:MAG: TolC family protein [Sphingobacteriaceae bacterium]|nr:MAG: TolC family protein [Sphingobacteriaceae bacterium]